MYDGSIYHIINLGKQAIVIDRCNISKLYRQLLDTLRVKEVKRLKKELLH